MSLRDFQRSDLRLVLLRLMIEANGEANENVLRAGAAELGHAWATRDDLRAELTWLKEHGLVEHEWFEDRVLVAAITERGVDVAEGRTVIEGVKRPSIARGS